MLTYDAQLYQLVEPVDSLHPTQAAQALITEQVGIYWIYWLLFISIGQNLNIIYHWAGRNILNTSPFNWTKSQYNLSLSIDWIPVFLLKMSNIAYHWEGWDIDFFSYHFNWTESQYFSLPYIIPFLLFQLFNTSKYVLIFSWPCYNLTNLTFRSGAA